MQQIVYTTSRWIDAAEPLKQKLLTLTKPAPHSVINFIIEICPDDLDMAVAMIGDSVVGWSVWTRKGFYTNVFVDPAHRKQGIGGKLLQIPLELSPTKTLVCSPDLQHIPRNTSPPIEVMSLLMKVMKRAKDVKRAQGLAEQEPLKVWNVRWNAHSGG